LIDWCLTPTLAVFQLHSGVSLYRIPVYSGFSSDMFHCICFIKSLSKW